MGLASLYLNKDLYDKEIWSVGPENEMVAMLLYSNFFYYMLWVHTPAVTS